MSKVTTGATMSLDGNIAEDHSFEYLFKWCSAGDTQVPTGNVNMTFKVTAASAEHLRRLNERIGALRAGTQRSSFCPSRSSRCAAGGVVSATRLPHLPASSSS
jgi:hypothetical protein